jgi:uncharacterized protein (TIGR00255 family)
MAGESGELQSMTGFATAQGNDGDVGWAWEIRSVNGKGLDVRFRGPPGTESLELPARQLAAANFARGNIQLTLSLKRDRRQGQVAINRPALDEIVAIAEELRGSNDPPAIEHLLAIRGVVELVDSDEMFGDELRDAVLTTLEEGLAALAGARLREGADIAGLLRRRLDEIERLTDVARTNPARSAEVIRARLAEQVAALVEASSALDPVRLHQEAAMLATKADIGEELDRLDAHVAAARNLLSDGGAVGRRLDFLAQEFNREANTLCSKANDITITATGLDLKATVDQFREQLQNLE